MKGTILQPEPCPPACKAWQGGCRVPPEYCQDWRAWKNYADDLGQLCESLSGEMEKTVSAGCGEVMRWTS